MSNSHSMSNEQARVLNTQQFRKKFGILHQAAIGVVLIRTKEPFRAVDALRDFAFADNMEFKLWTILQGWQSYDKSRPTDDPTADPATTDPLAALKAITGMGGGKAFAERGVFVMMNPHKPLSNHIGMVQCVKEYAKAFPSGHQRLVLVTPFGFTLPDELQDDVVILDFDVPSYAELRSIYAKLMDGVPSPKRPKYSDVEVDQIIANGAGMTHQEFENALSRALVSNRAALPDIPHEIFAGMVGEVKTEVVKRSEVLELMEPVDMADVGGLENLKHWIAMRVDCFGQEARDEGVDPPKGIALIGPPGTGKSLGAKAISSVMKIPLIKMDVGRLFNSLVGASESRAREATKMIDSMAPCVVMIDEVDKAFQANSGGGDSGVGTRVLGTLLTWMQETKAPVFLVVTANRTQNLPSEFLRRGRLDEIFNVTVPTEEERMAIIRIHLRKRKADPDAIEGLEKAVERSAGYVSAEIEAAVKDAKVISFSTKVPLTGQLIADQFDTMVPLSEAFKEDFERMEEWAAQNARPASLISGQAPGAARPGQAPKVRSRPAPRGDNRAMALESGSSSLDG